MNTDRSEAASARMKSAAPVLASLNLQESVDFYTRRLGFTMCNQFDNYAIVARDGVEIHFWLCQERHIAENTSCYIRVVNTQALFEELTSNGLPLAEPLVQPWGMKELVVFDPHGNLLKFGEPV